MTPTLQRRYPFAAALVALLFAVVAAAVQLSGSSGAPADETTSVAPSVAAASSSTLSSSTLSPSSATAAATTSLPVSASPSGPAPAAVLIGAGDICRLDAIANARKTLTLLQAEPAATVFTLGDNSNQEGTAAQYRDCYATTWGLVKDRTHPTVGNHDQYTSHGAAYYAYFGAGAGKPGQGYYSYNLAANWHVIVLNGICGESGGCGTRAPQTLWLRADLAANKGKHILAMWHPPAFSSGGHGNSQWFGVWWNELYAARAEIVLAGHDHDYERFARQSPTGVADTNGIREFVVGTGGASHSPILFVKANSEVRNSSTFGVLKLTLGEHSYRWQFVPVAGGKFTDSGETATHF